MSLRPWYHCLRCCVMAIGGLAGTVLASPELSVALDPGGRLSVMAHDAEVIAVLERVASEARIDVRILGEIPRQKGDWEFEDLPLDEGLKRLLADISHITLWQRDPRAPPRLVSVWILSDNDADPGARLPVTPPARPATTTGQAAATPLAGQQPSAEEIDSQIALVAVNGLPDDPGARRQLEDLLFRQSPQVRMAVVAALARSGDERAQPLLAQLLYSDPDPDVRLEAATALGQSYHPQAIDLLQAAKDDKDPRVREYIADLLAGLGAPVESSGNRP